MNVRSKPFLCQCCNHSFRDAYGLNRHLRARSKYMDIDFELYKTELESISKDSPENVRLNDTNAGPGTSKKSIEIQNPNNVKKDYGLRKHRKPTFKKSAGLKLKNKTQLKVKLKVTKKTNLTKSNTVNSKENVSLKNENLSSDENSTKISKQKNNYFKTNNKKDSTSKLIKPSEDKISNPIQIRRRQLKKRYLRFLNSIDYNDLLDVAEEFLTNMKIIAANKCFKAIRNKNIQKVE